MSSKTLKYKAYRSIIMALGINDDFTEYEATLCMAEHIDMLDDLIAELDAHEGAEGWSKDLEERLEKWRGYRLRTLIGENK